MKRLYLLFIATAIFLFSFTALTVNGVFGEPALHPSKLNIAVRFNKLVYEAQDSALISLTIRPEKDISDVRITLKVGKENNRTFERTYFLGNLKGGIKQTAEFSKKRAKDFGLGFGANPLSLEVTSKQKVIYIFATELGLRKSYLKEKLKTALAINLGDKPHIDTNKNIIDTGIQKHLLSKIEKYQEISASHKGFINFVFEPLLAETLGIIANGYTLNEGGSLTPVPSNSPSSVRAGKYIENFKKLFRAKEAHLLTSTYSQPNPNKLLETDIYEQQTQGKKVLSNILSDVRVKATYYPNYKIIFNKQRYLPTTKEALAGDKEAAVIKAFAYLAEAFNDEKNKIVLLSANMPSPDAISFFIQNAKKESWLELKNLDDLKPLTLKKIRVTKKAKRRSRQLSQARYNYFALKKALLTDNPSFNQAQTAIYLAEDKSTSPQAAKQLAIEANRRLRQEMDKVSLILTPLALTSREGKIPIKIINNTGSRLKLYLDIKTKGLEIKGGKKPVMIETKENLVSLPVIALKGGRHKVLVQLKTNGTTLDKKYFFVSTNLPGIFWYYAGIGFAFILLFVLGAFYVRKKRSQANDAS